MSISASEVAPQEDGPAPEHMAGISLWQQFESLDDEAQKAIFDGTVRAFHHSSALGLSKEQLEARKSLYEELLRDTEAQLRTTEPREVIDGGHDR